jgi:hypothetical protein
MLLLEWLGVLLKPGCLQASRPMLLAGAAARQLGQHMLLLSCWLRQMLTWMPGGRGSSSSTSSS